MLIVAIAVVAAVIALLLVGGHGPGRHFGLETPGRGLSTFLAVPPW